MTNFTALQTQLAAVMESLVHAAVAELGKLVEDGSVFLFNLDLTRCGGAEDKLAVELQSESQVKMVSLCSDHSSFSRVNRKACNI